MRTEQEIRDSIAKLSNAAMWKDYADTEVALASFREYMITWAEAVVFDEHPDKRSFYCTNHKRFYLQDKTLGANGQGCPQCRPQAPTD